MLVDLLPGGPPETGTTGQPASNKPKPANPDGIGASGKRYEDEFEFEKQRIKARNELCYALPLYKKYTMPSPH